jgi:hypothetical protein
MVYAYVLTFQNIGGNYFIVLIVWSIIWRVQFWFFFSFAGFGYDALFHFKVWTCFLFYLLFYFVYCFFFSLDFVFWLFGPSKAVMLLRFCICFACGFTFVLMIRICLILVNFEVGCKYFYLILSNFHYCICFCYQQKSVFKWYISLIGLKYYYDFI